MKICAKCKIKKNKSLFYAKQKSKDSLDIYCKDCRKAMMMQYRNTREVDKIALDVFKAIDRRCKSERYHQDRPKYKNIENKLNKLDFIAWYVKNYFKGCEVDRIDDLKDYSMDNIQLLSKEEHNHKRKIERDGYIKDGLKKCNRCNALKPSIIEFWSTHKKQISIYNPLGFRGICRECLNKQRKILYQNKKGVKDV